MEKIKVEQHNRNVIANSLFLIITLFTMHFLIK